MKIEVALDEGFGVVARGVHHRNGLTHGGEHFFIRALCGEGGNFRFQNLPNLGQMRGAFHRAAADHAIQGLLDGAAGAIGDEGSPTGIGFDQALFPQGLHGLADGGAANAELLGEFALGGELLSFFEFAADDRVLNLLHNLFVQPGCLNDFIHLLSLPGAPNAVPDWDEIYEDVPYQ